MEQLQGLLAVSLVMLAMATPAQADDIRLFTFASPPYQIVSEIPGPSSDVRGLTVDTVVCAAKGAGRQVDINAVPPRRAVQFLMNNLIDGYFAVDPSTSLDQVAFRTDPVSLEKWHMVSRSGSDVPENPRIGAVLGSNEEAWLRSQGKEVFLTVRTPQQLIALLQRQRIDKALMDQRVLESLSDTGNLRSEFLRYVPLHVYLSSRFAGENPEFIKSFNQQIPACINGSFDLDDTEVGQIRAIAFDLFRELEAKVAFKAAIQDGPYITSLSKILNLDAKWRAMAPLQHSEMARRVADQPASIAMGEWQNSHRTLVTEVMLTNRLGTLVAMSQLTSDFWQGDEPKFERHVHPDRRDLYVSPIRYDASTSRFQVTVSMAITTEDQWLPEGVLVIGLDVEQALADERHVRYLTQVPRP